MIRNGFEGAILSASFWRFHGEPVPLHGERKVLRFERRWDLWALGRGFLEGLVAAVRAHYPNVLVCCQGIYVLGGTKRRSVYPTRARLSARLLERHHLGQELFADNGYLAAQGVRLQEGTIVDATIIAAPTSTKNRTGAEMRQVKKNPESTSERTRPRGWSLQGDTWQATGLHARVWGDAGYVTEAAENLAGRWAEDRASGSLLEKANSGPKWNTPFWT